MKRNITAMLLAALLLLSGCSQPETAEESEASSAVIQSIYGKIKEVYGNEIVLALGEYESAGQPGGGMPMGGEMPQSDMPAERGMPEGERPNRGDGGEAPDGGGMGEMPNMGEMPAGGEMPSGMGNNDINQQAGRMQTQFTLNGEEVRYQIPVTAALTTGQGENQQELRFTQLAVKNIVCLNLDKTGKIVSLEVLE